MGTDAFGAFTKQYYFWFMPELKRVYIYILTNRNNTALYTGVTGNLPQRIAQHKSRADKSCFTYRYNCDKLVWYEECLDAAHAIEREKQIKGGSRKRKIELIQNMNSAWRDLYDELIS